MSSPPDPSQGSLFQPSARPSNVRVGPAGWHYKDWDGIVYPSKKSHSFDPLAFLADYVDTIEINSSFYHPPRPRDSASWARRVRNNKRFKFTAKAWQKITHERKEAAHALSMECDEVRRSMAPLAEAGFLGALLIQFPWSFRNTEPNHEYLTRVFASLQEFPLVVELRHGTWNQESFYEFLSNSGVAFCNVDQPVIGNSLQPLARVTSPVGYFRLHGRNYKNWFKEDAGRDARYDYLYSKEEISEVSRLIKIVKDGAVETYAITNNHFQGQALANAFDILQELDQSPQQVPSQLAAAYPHLARKS